MAFAPRSFSLSAAQVGPGTRVVAVEGEIHVSTAPDFRTRLGEILAFRPHRLVIDLSGVEFIDSTGLSVLLSAMRRIDRAGGRLALVITNPTVMRLFQITGLDETFAIHATRDGALASLAPV